MCCHAAIADGIALDFPIDEALEIHTIIAKGQVMVSDREVQVSGTFEGRYRLKEL